MSQDLEGGTLALCEGLAASRVTLLTIMVIAASLVLVGCASRSRFEEDKPVKPITDLYNRNFVVAAPTAVGNIICGAPFFLMSGAFDALYKGKREESYYRALNTFYFVPAAACGAITGTLFIPFSYACKEDPWRFGFNTTSNVSWGCR